jgi:4-amino-4-deoxychorismate lyase
MHSVIYLNKTMVEASKARVAPISTAMLYGRGVFATLAVYGGHPFRWSAHWLRLQEAAQRLTIDLSTFSEDRVGEALQKLITVNRVQNGRARVVLLARSGRDFWRTPQQSGRQTDLLIMTGDEQKVRDAGLSLAVSPHRINTFSPLTGIKTLNYLQQVLSWEEAQAREFDEAIVLNERGDVVSATMANLFWVKDGTVHTPTIGTGAYAGVTREVVLELANKKFIPVLEGVYELGDLTEADELFLTSSSLGVAVVTTFDFRQYAITPESIGTRLRAAFDQEKGD